MEKGMFADFKFIIWICQFWHLPFLDSIIYEFRTGYQSFVSKLEL